MEEKILSVEDCTVLLQQYALYSCIEINEHIVDKFVTDVRMVANSAMDMHTLTHVLKPLIFAKNNIIGVVSESMKTLGIEEKKTYGSLLNILRSKCNEAIMERSNKIKEMEIASALETDSVDGSLSIKRQEIGSIHAITAVMSEVISIFETYGCKLSLGSEVETSRNNFDMLNVLKTHPARDMHDTFYLNGLDGLGENYLLRTHTTCIDIATLLSEGVPLKTVSFGKTFRRDSDRTHSPMFHQIEFLEVGEHLHLGHLKAVVEFFLREFFQTDDIAIRLRPSYFPFTEPSIEVDVMYRVENGKIIFSKTGDKFMEILGCGILRSVVLENCNIDSSKYVGIAAGIGLERLIMLKYGIDDLRHFFSSDIENLSKCSFDSSFV